MTFQLAAGSFLAFLLALVRATAWLSFTPPFSSPAVPKVVRFGLASALALAVTAQMAHTTGLSSPAGVAALTSGAYITDLVVQAATGCALGFIVSIMLSVVQAAGSFTDMTSGLSSAQLFDPISGTSNPVTANTYNVILTTLLFATGGDLVIVKGFLTSFKAIGLDGTGVGLLGQTLMSEIGFFFEASLEIAAPVMGTMFLTYVAMGLLTRTAPQLNVMSLGFALNIAIALVVLAATLPLLPGTVTTLVDRGVSDGLGILGVHP